MFCCILNAVKLYKAMITLSYPSILLSDISCIFPIRGPFKCYVTQMGVGGCQIFWKKSGNEGVIFNVISVTRDGWGSNLQKNSVT